eukprot:355239-Chlamydomonas_euryale.AAC.3
MAPANSTSGCRMPQGRCGCARPHRHASDSEASTAGGRRRPGAQRGSALGMLSFLRMALRGGRMHVNALTRQS